MLSPQAQQVLFGKDWVRHLPEARRGEVAELLREIEVPQGTVLVREGEAVEAGYLLVTGAVDLTREERPVSRVAPGEMLGIAMDADEIPMFTARAALDCRLLMLRMEDRERLDALAPHVWAETAGIVGRRVAALVGGGAGASAQTAVLYSREPWPAQRETAIRIAEALEIELGGPVAIVTGAAEGVRIEPARPNGLDWVLSADPSSAADRRALISEQLGEKMAHVPFVLAELHESLRGQDAALEADLVIERVVGDGDPEPSRPGRRYLFLHDRRDGSGPALSRGDVVALPPDEPARTQGYERLARRVCGHSIGLALGSGAAWGLAHIGVLSVLEDAGVPIDVIAGSSMGAIVGAHYALGYSASEIAEISTRIKTLPDIVGILPQLLYMAADLNVTKPGIFAGEHFKNVLASIAPIEGKTFLDLEIPFRAIATDIETGARAELGEGQISDAVHASFAAPAILSPYRIGDRIFIDGGMVDPVPSETARRMGADLVIAVNVVPPIDADVHNPLDRALGAVGRINPLARLRGEEERRLPGAIDVLMRTIQIMQYQLGNDRAGDADILINPELKEFWMLEFWAAAAMIERGAEATREALPAIQEKLTAFRKAAI